MQKLGGFCLKISTFPHLFAVVIRATDLVAFTMA